MSKALKHFVRGLTYRVRFFGKQISIGRGAKISRRCSLQLYGGGAIKLGRNCRIMDYAMSRPTAETSKLETIAALIRFACFMATAA